ncbi:TPA: hypothetical protein ACWO8L_004853 [Salmonella enterica subsp. enterica serovar Muenchen]
MSPAMKSLFKRVVALLDIAGKVAWVWIAVYSIWLGIERLFNDKSFSLDDQGGKQVISVLDTTPVALMFILCGVIILTFMWVGYRRKKLENGE